MSTKLKIIIAVVVIVFVAIVWYLIYKNKKSTKPTTVSASNPTPTVKTQDFEYNGIVYLIPESEFTNPKAPVSDQGFALANPDTWAAYLANFKTRPKTVRESLGL